MNTEARAMAEPTHLLRAFVAGERVEFRCYGDLDLKVKKEGLRQTVWPVAFEVEELREGS